MRLSHMCERFARDREMLSGFVVSSAHWACLVAVLERRDAFAGSSGAALDAALAGFVGVGDVGDVVPDAVSVALVKDADVVLDFPVGAVRVRGHLPIDARSPIKHRSRKIF